MDRSWPKKSGIGVRKLISTLKKQKTKNARAGNESSNLPSKKPPLEGKSENPAVWCRKEYKRNSANEPQCAQLTVRKEILLILLLLCFGDRILDDFSQPWENENLLLRRLRRKD